MQSFPARGCLLAAPPAGCLTGCLCQLSTSPPCAPPTPPQTHHRPPAALSSHPFNTPRHPRQVDFLRGLLKRLRAGSEVVGPAGGGAAEADLHHLAFCAALAAGLPYKRGDEPCLVVQVRAEGRGRARERDEGVLCCAAAAGTHLSCHLPHLPRACRFHPLACTAPPTAAGGERHRVPLRRERAGGAQALSVRHRLGGWR